MRSVEQPVMTAIQPLPTGLAYRQPLLAHVGLPVPASSPWNGIQTVLLFPLRVLAALSLLPLIFAWSAIGAALLPEEPCG